MYDQYKNGFSRGEEAHGAGCMEYYANIKGLHACIKQPAASEPLGLTVLPSGSLEHSQHGMPQEWSLHNEMGKMVPVLCRGGACTQLRSKKEAKLQLFAFTYQLHHKGTQY